MSNYSNGSAFERRVAVDLERDGYACMRAAGSKGAADLIALKPGQVLLVQCKRTNGQLPPHERRALTELAARVAAIAVVAFQPVPRKPIEYRQLTGAGPKEWVRWVADEVDEVAAGGIHV